MIRITKTRAQAQREQTEKEEERRKTKICPECGSDAETFNATSEGLLYEKTGFLSKKPYRLMKERCSNRDCRCEWEWRSYR